MQDAHEQKTPEWHAFWCVLTALRRLATLQRANAERHPQPGLIHHSGRGVQYAGQEYVEQLKQIGARVSMSPVTTPHGSRAGGFWNDSYQVAV